MLSHDLAVINTDVGLHSECLPHISRQPSLKYKADLSPYFLSPHLSDQFTIVDWRGIYNILHFGIVSWTA